MVHFIPRLLDVALCWITSAAIDLLESQWAPSGSPLACRAALILRAGTGTTASSTRILFLPVYSGIRGQEQRGGSHPRSSEAGMCIDHN